MRCRRWPSDGLRYYRTCVCVCVYCMSSSVCLTRWQFTKPWPLIWFFFPAEHEQRSHFHAFPSQGKAEAGRYIWPAKDWLCFGAACQVDCRPYRCSGMLYTVGGVRSFTAALCSPNDHNDSSLSWHLLWRVKTMMEHVGSDQDEQTKGTDHTLTLFSRCQRSVGVSGCS